MAIDETYPSVRLITPVEEKCLKIVIRFLERLQRTMKLNDTAPEQHMAILVITGVIIFLSVVDYFKSAPADEEGRKIRSGTYAQTGETLYDNPHLTWYERYLCRGYQRSSFCSYRMLHPFKDVFDAHGIKVKESPPKKNVVLYRGPLPKNRAFRSKMLLKSDG